MKVALAGFNLEYELMQTLARNHRVVLTPELISAAYARISRSSKPVEELRQDARREIEKARKSNVTIVFEMGHHSIAEHAVFNFDVTGVSRLAVEALERHRLNSYTEKSQRYVTLSDDFVVPEELKDTEVLDEFVTTVRLQNHYYHELYYKLVPHFTAKHPEWRDEPLRAENAAKEDARYITGLAIQTQLGMTANARNLELMLKSLSASELAEVRALSARLYEQTVAVAPSLIVFPEPTDYEKNTYARVREYSQTFMTPAFNRRPRNFIALAASDVALVDYTQNADNKLLAAILHSVSRASHAECMNRVERQTLARKKEIFKLACQDMQAYDAVLREFEHLSLTFELVISASGFAQLKRHRLMTITAQPYDPKNGWTIPTSIAEIKEHKSFKEMLARTEEVFDRVAAFNPAVAQYVLTNSHQRRVLVTVDARELYHISRLREDPEAQWDIRDIAGRMMEQARHVMPLTLALACGKDNYPRVYEELFGRPPAVTELKLPEARPLPVQTEKAPRKRPKNRDRNSPPRHKDTKMGPDVNVPDSTGAVGGSVPASGKKLRPKKSEKE
ncbi:MAG TPA: FAD-dependent thymidylate synthase [bacterium]|nr:FAD-dependent thymidylate synthase [bacterium]